MPKTKSKRNDIQYTFGSSKKRKLRQSFARIQKRTFIRTKDLGNGTKLITEDTQSQCDEIQLQISSYENELVNFENKLFHKSPMEVIIETPYFLKRRTTIKGNHKLLAHRKWKEVFLKICYEKARQHCGPKESKQNIMCMRDKIMNMCTTSTIAAIDKEYVVLLQSIYDDMTTILVDKLLLQSSDPFPEMQLSSMREIYDGPKELYKPHRIYFADSSQTLQFLKEQYFQFDSVKHGFDMLLPASGIPIKCLLLCPEYKSKYKMAIQIQRKKITTDPMRDDIMFRLTAANKQQLH